MPGARRRVGARAPLSRSGLEHAVTTDHLAGDPPPEEATDASADRAAPATPAAPSAPDATAPGP
ncbi:hypothetical protein EEJ42_34435, partial [Streptomyces botrytidirepellens]